MVRVPLTENSTGYGAGSHGLSQLRSFLATSCRWLFLCVNLSKKLLPGGTGELPDQLARSTP